TSTLSIHGPLSSARRPKSRPSASIKNPCVRTLVVATRLATALSIVCTARDADEPALPNFANVAPDCDLSVLPGAKWKGSVILREMSGDLISCAAIKQTILASTRPDRASGRLRPGHL